MRRTARSIASDRPTSVAPARLPSSRTKVALSTAMPPRRITWLLVSTCRSSIATAEPSPPSSGGAPIATAAELCRATGSTGVPTAAGPGTVAQAATTSIKARAGRGLRIAAILESTSMPG